jgi:hypothetical protein
MSSETSTTSHSAAWQLLRSLLATIGCDAGRGHCARGQPLAAIILLSLVVFAAAGMGAAALRTLLPFIAGHERLDVPLAGRRARVAIEREKTLALRAIKDLEFDHAMGKVSDQDFAEMSGRLRTGPRA